jgi:hypothetical protein
MAALATIGSILTIGSAVVGAGASIYSAYNSFEQGKAMQAEAERQALVDEQSGKSEYAASQREAELRRLEGKLIMSRQQAYAAASGAGSGADDPTIMTLMSETGSNAELGARVALYQGASREADYFNSAQARRISGRNNFVGKMLEGFGSLAGGVGRLADSSGDWIPAFNRLGVP